LTPKLKRELGNPKLKTGNWKRSLKGLKGTGAGALKEKSLKEA